MLILAKQNRFCKVIPANVVGPPTPESPNTMKTLPPHVARLSAVALAFLAAFAAVGTADDGPANLLPQGEFKTPGDPEGWAFRQGWMKGRMAVVEEDGQTLLRAPGPFADMSAEVTLPPGTKTVTLTVDARLKDFKPGKGKWDIPSVSIYAVDAAGEKQAGKGIRYREDGDWSEKSQTIEVPAGVTKVGVTVSYRGEAGTWDVRSVRVTGGS